MLLAFGLLLSITPSYARCRWARTVVPPSTNYCFVSGVLPCPFHPFPPFLTCLPRPAPLCFLVNFLFSSFYIIAFVRTFPDRSPLTRLFLCLHSAWDIPGITVPLLLRARECSIGPDMHVLRRTLTQARARGVPGRHSKRELSSSMTPPQAFCSPLRSSSCFGSSVPCGQAPLTSAARPRYASSGTGDGGRSC